MSAREAILKAAAELASEQGVTALGVEQVNRRAGVSKGAFFYHFKTKEEMIHALVDYVSERFTMELEESIARGERFTDAIITQTFREVISRGPMISGLIAAVSLDRSLAPKVRQQVEAWTDRMIEEDGLTRDRAELVRLALDGLLMSTLLYDRSEAVSQIERFRRVIEKLARGQLG